MPAEIRTIQDVIDLLLDSATGDTAARLKAAAALASIRDELVETFGRSAELADSEADDARDHRDDAWVRGRWTGRAEAFIEAASVVRGER